MSENRARGPMGGHRSRAMNSGEKAKDFKSAMKRLFQYMERYKFRFILMFIFAIAGTIFSIVGPKILGKATTELFNGLLAKVNGTGSIDFGKIGYILLWTLGLYLASACFSFIQGYVMTGISNDVTYNLRKDISRKFSRLPMNYYESRTNGEILSRVTNDVDTLQMSLNQSITQLITSVTTLVGVFAMMLSINVWMTLAALLILPLSMIIISFVMKHSQKYFQAQQKYLGKVNGQIEENYGGHNVVKVFNKEEDVVHDFSARVKDGQKIAIVGPTGAGKTTMVKLLMRFYDVNSGSIRVDGYNVKDFNRSELHEMFGMVLQDTWLFSGTIMENIRYGRLDATDEEVIAAAKAAHIHNFIMQQPGGYQMVLDEETSNVSQGQKQLLTIARAILADNKILILDEATSSVDTRTEVQIQKAMDNLMKGRTSFVIAHRLSTIKDADLILVMKDGDIIEQGNHEELLARKGFYADLYNSQFDKTQTA